MSIQVDPKSERLFQGEPAEYQCVAKFGHVNCLRERHHVGIHRHRSHLAHIAWYDHSADPKPADARARVASARGNMQAARVALEIVLERIPGVDFGEETELVETLLAELQ